MRYKSIAVLSWRPFFSLNCKSYLAKGINEHSFLKFTSFLSFLFWLILIYFFYSWNFIIDELRLFSLQFIRNFIYNSNIGYIVKIMLIWTLVHFENFSFAIEWQFNFVSDIHNFLYFISIIAHFKIWFYFSTFVSFLFKVLTAYIILSKLKGINNLDFKRSYMLFNVG